MPETLEELCDYIVEYSDVIFIREQVNGKWGSYSLKELPSELALKHALRFIKEGIVPVRLLREAERK